MQEARQGREKSQLAPAVPRDGTRGRCCDTWAGKGRRMSPWKGQRAEGETQLKTPKPKDLPEPSKEE